MTSMYQMFSGLGLITPLPLLTFTGHDPARVALNHSRQEHQVPPGLVTTGSSSAMEQRAPGLICSEEEGACWPSPHHPSLNLAGLC